MAIGKKISLVRNVNPLRVVGRDKFIPRIQETLEGWSKDDPATVKKLPVEADVPEWVANLSLEKGAIEQMQVIGDCMLFAFYFLLRIGEYTKKRTQNEPKQTKQFKLEDCTFFKKNSRGKLRQLSRRAPDGQIMACDSVTLKLDN